MYVEGKTVPQHVWRRREERSYRSYLFTTSALDGSGGQRHASAALYFRGKDPQYALERRLVGHRAGLDTEATGKILSPLPGMYVRT
jgi:hypothetical protein